MKSFFNIFNNEDEPSKKSPLTKYIIGGIAGLCLFLVVITTIVTVVFAPIMMAEQMIEDIKNNVSLFFEKVGNVLTLNGWCADSDGSCQKKAGQKYYEKLNDVYNDYQDDGVEIDTQLITATIFYGRSLSEDKFLNEEQDDGEEIKEDTDVHLTDVKKLAKNMVSGSGLDYDKYRSYLEETYIPKRFSDMYTQENEEKAVKKIADEIMAFASGKGSGSFANCSVINTSCTGITIKSGSYAGTYTLEEYIAGVVNHEVGAGWPDEAIKAQAIAARTFALKYTDNCTKEIENSTNAQTFSPATDERIKKLVDETAGMVMTYNGEIINSEYGSWWGNNRDSSCEAYHDCQNGNCSIDLYKSPNKEKWTFEMPQNYFSWSNVTDSIQMDNSTIRSLGGHCRGMSQFGAKYLDLGKNYKYDQILETFYSDGVQLSSFGNSQNSCPSGTSTQGLIASNYRGFMQRVGNPTASDYYYSQEYMYSSNVGQCVWYVQRRALEIMETVEIDEDTRQKAIAALKNTYGNGRDWWNNPSLTMFGSSTNYAEPKVGAIIVWRYTQANINSMGADYGHVAMVEAVDYENKTMTVSDGWKSNWGAPNSIEYASFGFRTVPFEWALDYGNPNKYIFMGYVYLLD